ncbi:MAG: protein-methionine-sulfoxide reductase catalytic subunit MsrP [Dehalococcoidales bacterium]|nr:MAG: protein-methionine-sulfoxide reductase catalytic subunit MsrP [Dehalococcoidales bacterium]
MTQPEKRSHLPNAPGSDYYPESLRDEITPEYLFMSRRKFISGIGAVAATAFLAACTPLNQDTSSTNTTGNTSDTASETISASSDTLTPFDDIINYNNFYEFTYEKELVAELARNFVTNPWSVNIGGLVDNPGSYSIEKLIELYTPEERIYRMRCVEGWSMVIPWIGFPLNKLLTDARPQPEAKFVRFESFYDPEQMPGDKSLPFPYYEGLRLDEANHDLTILATGLYDKLLPPQEGAPIRLVVPWKYGFKSAKSITRIDLVAEMPSTFWVDLSPFEYGFYANVNPEVHHPRWSQSTERRIGELKRRPTLLFNGYDEVASLYEGMDLRRFI